MFASGCSGYFSVYWGCTLYQSTGGNACSFAITEINIINKHINTAYKRRNVLMSERVVGHQSQDIANVFPHFNSVLKIALVVICRSVYCTLPWGHKHTAYR